MYRLVISTSKPFYSPLASIEKNQERRTWQDKNDSTGLVPSTYAWPEALGHSGGGPGPGD